MDARTGALVIYNRISMECLEKENWCYRLLRDDEKYYLEVLCGSVALYEICVQLSKSEINEYIKYGKIFCTKKAEEVRKNPQNFINMKIDE